MANYRPKKYEASQLALREKIKHRDTLFGFNEIAAYLCIYPGTARIWVLNRGLPAHPVSGNKYVTTKQLINQWIATMHHRHIIEMGLK